MGLMPKGGEAPRRVSFFSSDVVAGGPDGYCVDPASVQKRRDAGFALLASCAHMGRTPAAGVPPAIVTVSVLARDAGVQQPTAARLAAPWDNAGVAEQIDRDGIALIRLERGGNTHLPGGDPRHWRGALVINGHMIGLAAYGEAGSGVGGTLGRDLLIGVATAMREASPRKRPAEPAAAASPARLPSAAPEAGQAKALLQRPAKPTHGAKSMFRGLFRKPA